MPPLRIAFCITDLDVGGAERCLEQLVAGLDRDRFEPAVYCLAPRPKNEAASCAAAIEKAGVPVSFLGAKHVWHLPAAVYRLARMLELQSPQILQTFLFHANFVGRLAARRSRVPRLLAGIRVAEGHARWHLWMDLWTRNMVDRYVCVSRSVADFTAKHVGVPEERLVVIPNGIDLETLRGTTPANLGKLGVSPGKSVVTFVGRLEPQKGLSWLLDTAVRWLPQLQDFDLLLVGRGPQAKFLAAKANRLGIADRVRFAGWRSDVPSILAASDVLVLPSLWEGMPNVVLQAMGLGLPVLATEVQGVRELLGESAPPQTVAYGDTDSFVRKLIALMDDRPAARELGRQNRQRAASQFSLTSMIRAYEELWESLV